MEFILLACLAVFVAALLCCWYVRRLYVAGMARLGPKSGEPDCRLSIPFQTLNALSDILNIHLFRWSTSELIGGLDAKLADKYLGKEALPSLEEGARLLCEAVNRPGTRVTPTGRIAARMFLKTVTENRDNMLKYAESHPDVMKKPPRRPLMLLGMPRTGSTLLYSLLACDKSARVLHNWEQFEPFPPPPGGQAFYEDPRIKKVQDQQAKVAYIMPKFSESLNRIHYYDASAVEEELIFLCGLLVLFAHCMLLGDEAYEQWLFKQDDKAYLYRFLLVAMKVMVANYGEYDHWVLKSPLHSYYPTALFETMPDDVCYVMTHRDPRNVVPSCCKLVLYSMAVYVDEERWSNPDAAVDQTKLGSTVLKHMSLVTDRMMKARASHPDKKVIDVYYPEFIQDPIATVKHIYEHYGYDYTAEFEVAMREYLAKNRQYKHGKVTYTLEEFGLTESQISNSFSSYLDSHPRACQRM